MVVEEQEYIHVHTEVSSAAVINANNPTIHLQPLSVPFHFIHAENDHANPIGPVREDVKSISSEDLFSVTVSGNLYSGESVAKSGIWCQRGSGSTYQVRAVG